MVVVVGRKAQRRNVNTDCDDAVSALAGSDSAVPTSSNGDTTSISVQSKYLEHNANVFRVHCAIELS